MKQHPLCTDTEQGPNVLALPVPDGLKQEWMALETRRRFLGRTGKVLGWAALASLLGNRGMSGDAHAADAPAGQPAPKGDILKLPHFAPKAKRAIYLFMSGGAAADRHAGLQTESCCALRQGHSRLRSGRSAVDWNDGGAGTVSHRAFALGVQAVRQDGYVGERSAAEYGADCR